MLTAMLALFGTVALSSAIYGPIEARLPALLWPVHSEGARPPAVGAEGDTACSAAPPTEPELRRLWDAECR